MNTELLVIIPAYNEECSIERVIRSMRGLPYDFIVVNDGSKDATADLCRRNGVALLDLPFNQGLASAFQTGMRYACEHGYRYAMQLDADGQHLPRYIQPMLAEAEKGYDVVIGSRYLGKENSPQLAKGFGMSLIRGILRLTTGKTLTDPTSGMRIYSNRMIALFANEINFSPEPDTLAYLMRCGASVSETPVVMEERTTGKSYLTLSSSVKYMSRILLSILLVQFIRQKISL